MITKLVRIKEGINPINIDNNLVVNKICVILPEGVQGRISLRNVGTYEPILNIAVGFEQMQKNLYVGVTTQPTNFDGYLEVYGKPKEGEKAVISMLSSEEFSKNNTVNGE